MTELVRTEQIARLRITLEGIEPAIWRQVEVPLNATLKALHDVIQAAFGWEGYHLHLFEVGEERYGAPDPEWDGLRPLRSEKAIYLATLIERGIERFGYTYDFGDDWRHEIAIEALEAADPAKEYPRFLSGARRAPPEDVGGVPGYEEFVRAMTHPRHREHKAMLTWHGGPYDPEDIGEAEIVAALGKQARRRTLGRAAYLKSVDR
ncbi:plasmid pRiA4b ORF-3 family protein [Methylorubrum sp. Q1]|uniref:plasmid pRiA4b ORF-3 family protein n=1 Tax=Methylorubrum sp. Q1 TaxID=2562453 RepID=UPI001FE1659B|nr:plasmid pRiA4b ORF-3 family protein [Methylorubrum sp. Q1]